MKKYIFYRVLFIVIGVFLAATLMFFALSFALFEKHYSMSFNDFLAVAGRLYRVFLEQRILGMDWGLTYSGEPIIETVVPRFWITLRYNLIALAIYLPLGVIVGIVTAYKKGSWFDKLVSYLVLVFGSIPTYLLVGVLIIIFGYQLEIFPAHLYYVNQTFIGRILGYGIPIMALSAGAIAKISRVIRSEMVELLTQEYFLLARTKGLTKQQTFIRHLLKNSMVPLMPVLVEVFLLVLTGSFFVELAFGIHGVAELFYVSLIQIENDFGTNYILIDVNTIIVITSFYLIVGMGFSLLVDTTYYLIDPRIRIQSKK